MANQVKAISQNITHVVAELREQLAPRLAEVNRLGGALIAQLRGTRLADLALNLIKILDRNHYERSCEGRWWATDSVVVGFALTPGYETYRGLGWYGVVEQRLAAATSGRSSPIASR